MLVESDVPEGKGVSSSAAIEAATMEAVVGAWRLDGRSRRSRALSCQRVENLVVGAPCGVMDQMTAICGEAGSADGAALPARRVPGHGGAARRSGGVGHRFRHPPCRDRRRLRRRARRRVHGIPDPGRSGRTGPSTASDPATSAVDDPQWHGYLANVGGEGVRANSTTRIARALSGLTFLSRYGGTTDPVTRVETDRTYAVRTPTAHPDRTSTSASSSGRGSCVAGVRRRRHQSAAGRVDVPVARELLGLRAGIGRHRRARRFGAQGGPGRRLCGARRSPAAAAAAPSPSSAAATPARESREIAAEYQAATRT